MNRPVPLARLGLALGLVVGLVEGLEWALLGLVPGALSWRTGNSAYAVWMAPFVMGSVGLLAGLLARGGERLGASPRTCVTGLVASMAFLGAYLCATLQGQIFSELASLCIAAGIATAVTRWYRSTPDAFLGLALRLLPALVALTVVLAAGTVGWARLRERRALAALPAAPADAPNVLLLVLDTQRADHLSLYGYARPTSPRLDAFATGAVRYDNASSASSWTLPSHASLFTGQPLHAHRAGVMRRPFLDGRFPTIAEALRDAGYVTGAFVSNTFWVGRHTGLDRGFVRFEDYYGNPVDALVRTTLGRRLAYDVLPRFGLSGMPGRKWAPTLNADLLRWLDGVGPRPFFAFVNYFDVHAPLAPPAPFAGRFGSAGDQGRAHREIELGAIGTTMTLPPPERLAQLRDAYDESILALDAALGQLFDSLAARGLLERTVVIVTSDHGESWGEHGMIYHGHSLYREQVHVPLLVRWPNAAHAGTVVRSAVSIEQVPATILAGLGRPAGPFPGAPLPLADEPDAVVQTELARRSAVPGNWPASRGSVAALTTRDWHYIEEESGPAELFALTPTEDSTSVAGDSAHAPLLSGFRAALRRSLRGTGLPWPTDDAAGP